VNFNLNTYTTKADVLAAVDRIIYIGQNTNPTNAFRLARLQVLGPAYRERRHAQRLAVLITDGNPTHATDQLDGEVAAVKALDTTVVAFGVTDRVIYLLYFHRRSRKLTSTPTFEMKFVFLSDIIILRSLTCVIIPHV